MKNRTIVPLEPAEYKKIVSEINTLYYAKYQNKRLFFHCSYGIDNIAYVYVVENHGFNNYRFVGRTENI